MPELPEVESLRRILVRTAVGRTIVKVRIGEARLRRRVTANFGPAVAGRRIVKLSRRAKYLIVELDGDDVMLVHLGMSGSLTHRDEGFEHLQLAGRVHRVDESLVAVAQVHRAPGRGVLDLPVRPVPVGQAEREWAEGHVLLDRHFPGAGWYGRHFWVPSACPARRSLPRVWRLVRSVRFARETKTSCAGAGGNRRAPGWGSPQVRSRLLSKRFLFMVGRSLAGSA
jgi:hypothetical protein